MQCPFCQASVDDSQRFCPACGTVLAPAEAGPDPLLGQTLGGKYKVVRPLGEGGMGTVYEGEQLLGTTKRKVAIKTLHAHLSRDPKIKARFEREVGTVAELEHPNTIQVYDFGSTPDGILYIVMEFLLGKSLADLLEKQGAMSPERVANILQQVCGSLEEAHGRGIVHRDLKPDNVVLVERAGKKDFVKVLDFGIAKRAREEDKNEQKLTQQGMVLGTPPYMSPEQFTGQPIDLRSDIYSLGVMAYEMLTGKLPFKAETAWEWATQHMTQQPIPFESLGDGGEGKRVPEAMRSAVMRSLAKSPADRFPSVREFIDAFCGQGGAAAAGATPGGAQARQKTEMGAPLALPGGPAAPAPAFGGQGAAGHGFTPAAGNVSYPTPVGIPQPPPRRAASSGGRSMLLAAAAVIAVASVVAIVFSMKGGSGGTNSPVVFDNGAPTTPATTQAPNPGPSAASAPPVDSSSGDNIPPLAGGGGATVVSGGRTAHPQAHPGPPPPPGAGPAPPHTEPMPPPAATPAPAPALPPPPAPAHYDGPECQKARQLKALGHPREAEPWTLACTAKGGNPN